MRGYAIIDEHCDFTLIDDSVLEFFVADPSKIPDHEYTMSCASQQISFETSGKVTRL